MNRAALYPALMAFALAACAADRDEYPSLARRPAETAGTMPVPQTAPSPPASSTAPIAGLAGLVEQARIAHNRFFSLRGKAQQLANAARDSAMASESWAVASVALADLESARSEAMIALADLDQHYAAARIAGDDVKAIAAARDKVTSWIAEQDRVLADLRGRLGG